MGKTSEAKVAKLQNLKTGCLGGAACWEALKQACAAETEEEEEEEDEGEFERFERYSSPEELVEGLVSLKDHSRREQVELEELEEE
ncbi:hypothetical protein FQN55_008876 [Onygenales sp. PD_40]|nr:hypothetical protein FQN55_008876 [Onygenales sp. PD_40]